MKLNVRALQRVKKIGLEPDQDKTDKMVVHVSPSTMDFF